jgi:hypothetical protein
MVVQLPNGRNSARISFKTVKRKQSYARAKLLSIQCFTKIFVVPYGGGNPMIWFRIRKAKIDPSLREAFEQYGLGTMQLNLAIGDFITQNGKTILIKDVTTDLLSWLTEQYDRAERKETWSITMEVAITGFVFFELIFSIIGYLKSN